VVAVAVLVHLLVVQEEAVQDKQILQVQQEQLVKVLLEVTVLLERHTLQQEEAVQHQSEFPHLLLLVVMADLETALILHGLQQHLQVHLAHMPVAVAVLQEIAILLV
jgi:hypothetical protein